MDTSLSNISDNGEIYGWLGNGIFVTAQTFQIVHTFRVKKTEDISYGLQIMLFIGNLMYMTFGYLDDSTAMFIGNLLTTFTTTIQIGQKIYYDRKSKKYAPII